MERTKKTSKNVITTLTFFILNSIFSFISKTIFIKFLGIEFAGLNSLFTNVLGVLNIAELGLSAAVGYSLYKPLAEKDTKTINEILKLYKYLYRTIAIFILSAGLILTFFLQFMINSEIDIWQIRFSFILYLISTVVSYLFTFLNVLPSANQQNYMVTKIQGIVKMVKNIIQLIAIIIFKNYYIWLVLEIGGNILGYMLTNIIIKKKYEYYEENNELEFKELLKKYKDIICKVRDLFFHKIGSLVVNQTDNIVISCFCTLTDVGIYGNYMLVYIVITGIFDQVFGSITSSVGNLIIEKGEKYAYKVWKELHIITVFLTVVVCCLFYSLINNFITIWVGEEYILSNAVIFAIALNIMFRIIKQPIDKFKDAFGIFWDKQAPFLEAIINLVASIILAKFYGIIGVVIGTVISNIIITAMWKPYIVFKHGFKEKISEYIKLNIPLIILSIIVIIISDVTLKFVNINIINGWIDLIISAVVQAIIVLSIGIGIFIVNKSFRNSFVKYVKIFLGLIIKR